MRWWLTGFAILLLPSAGRSEDPPTYVRHFGRTGSAPGLFRGPAGAAIDASGNIFVVEIASCRVQKFASDGTYRSGWGGRGAEPGKFELPTDIAIDAAQRLWVVDRGNDRLQCFDPDGHFLAAHGSTGHGAGQFYVPGGIAIRGSRMAVADTWNHRICLYDIVETRLEPVFVLGDSGSANGQFLAPQDVDLGPDGSIYVADSDNNRVQVFDSQGTYLRRLGTITRFQWVYGVAVDAHGNAYVSEPVRSQISKLTRDGVYLYTWGTAGPKVQKFNLPLRMTFDRDGLLVVVDYDDTFHSDRIVIWRPADVVTPVEPTSWSDVRRIYRGR
jgi:DNA-binding beta-propeller fold protein YncE